MLLHNGECNKIGIHVVALAVICKLSTYMDCLFQIYATLAKNMDSQQPTAATD